MPPFIVPPLVKYALVALGGAAVIHWVVKEARRLNAELDAQRVTAKIPPKQHLPTLRRDPRTGEYRL